MTELPDVLLLTPIMPSRGGNGLAMRAGAMLTALARRFRVHLFVVPVAGGSVTPDDFVRAYTSRIGVLDLDGCADTLAGLIARVQDPAERLRHLQAYPQPWLSRFATPKAVASIVTWLGSTQPAALHVMRLYLAPLGLAFMDRTRRIPCLLDIDDDETATRQGLADLHEAAGDAAQAELERSEAAKYTILATSTLGRFDRVATCSQVDATLLAQVHPAARFVVLPNIYLASVQPARGARAAGRAPRLLLLGNLGYLPNADAARFLAGDILAALRVCGLRPQIDIVGGGGVAPGIAADADVTVHGTVTDVAPFYTQADIAAVPLRAGGGTRIKILEAFAHHVPVVATTIAAMGLDLTPGREFLVADDAAGFAAACARLCGEPGLADAITTAAAARLAQHHRPPALAARIDSLWADLLL